MAKVIVGMTLSLDGYINDRTGAVVMGRTTFTMAEDPDWYAGNYAFRRPSAISHFEGKLEEVPVSLTAQTDAVLIEHLKLASHITHPASLRGASRDRVGLKS